MKGLRSLSKAEATVVFQDGLQDSMNGSRSSAASGQAREDPITRTSRSANCTRPWSGLREGSSWYPRSPTIRTCPSGLRRVQVSSQAGNLILKLTGSSTASRPSRRQYRRYRIVGSRMATPTRIPHTVGVIDVDTGKERDQPRHRGWRRMLTAVLLGIAFGVGYNALSDDLGYRRGYLTAFLGGIVQLRLACRLELLLVDHHWSRRAASFVNCSALGLVHRSRLRY